MRRRFLWLLKNTFNRLALRMARSGRGPFALVRHKGRKSGTVYETPIMVAAVPEGFIAELLVDGVIHRVVAIEPYPVDAGRRAFGMPRRLVLQLLRRYEFRLLRTSR
jgi:hypothetical protein